MAVYSSNVNVSSTSFTSCTATGRASNAYDWGGAMYLSDSKMTVSSTPFTSCTASYSGSGNDINIENGGSLTCTAGCSEAGMYMPSGNCTSPVAADISGGTCASYCASSSSDCAVCPSDTYYDGYSDNNDRASSV